MLAQETSWRERRLFTKHQNSDRTTNRNNNNNNNNNNESFAPSKQIPRISNKYMFCEQKEIHQIIN